MKKNFRQTTRREFLKTSGKIAGTVILSGLAGSCAQGSAKSGAMATEAVTPPVARDAYKIFYKGQIGSMTVKNRLVR